MFLKNLPVDDQQYKFMIGDEIIERYRIRL